MVLVEMNELKLYRMIGDVMYCVLIECRRFHWMEMNMSLEGGWFCFRCICANVALP